MYHFILLNHNLHILKLVKGSTKEKATDYSYEGATTACPGEFVVGK